MKSLVALTCSILTDAANLYSIDPTLDIQTIESRYRREGEPFLTITLDAFRVAFEAALESGTWDNISIPGFRKDGQLPAFLRGFVSLVFQRNGSIRKTPHISAIRSIRQICGLSAKMYEESKPAYTHRALVKYLEIDSQATSRATSDLTMVFASLFDPVLREVADLIDGFDLPVDHGNGASQDKLLPNSRWQFAQWDEGFEPFFPSWRYVHLNDGHARVKQNMLKYADKAPVKVAFVPKTAKGPRTIAVEPSWRTFVQKGLATALMESIESHGLPPRFTDSDKNRDLARKGSIDGSLATIDLSAASDSVSKDLVYDLLAGRPLVRDALFAARSKSAQLPDGSTIQLNKFAGMGSATCFPIEAMVFAAIAVLAMAKRDRLGNVKLSSIREVSKSVTVFGDDIIVPSGEYQPVVDLLETFGFQVNVNKSFYQGLFRESCGGDYYAGHDVSYVKLRQRLCFSTQNAVDTISTVSFRNQLAERGLSPSTVESLDVQLKAGLGMFPEGTLDSSGLVRTHSPFGVKATPTAQKSCRKLHVGMIKCWVPVSDLRTDVLDSWDGLNKSIRLAERRDKPAEQPSSYETAGRAVRVRLIARWDKI